MTRQFRRALLPALAMSLLTLSVWFQPSLAQNANANYVQAATCGSAKSEFFKTTDDSPVTIDREGTMWAGTNVKEGDKCGMICFFDNNTHVLKSEQTSGTTRRSPTTTEIASEVIFDSLDEAAKAKINLTFVFRPQLERPDLISITKPLTDFQFKEYYGHPLVLVVAKDVFKHVGVADLKTLTIASTGIGRVVVRHIRIECEKNYWDGKEIRLPALDCSALPTDAK